MNRETICIDNQYVGDFYIFMEDIIGIPEKEKAVRNSILKLLKAVAKDSDISYNNIDYISLDRFNTSDLERIIEEVTFQFGEADSYSISNRETMLRTTIIAVEWND